MKTLVLALSLLPALAQAVPITYDYTAFGSVNTNPARTHIFGTVTLDVDQNAFDFTDGYVKRWYLAGFTLGYTVNWDGAAFDSSTTATDRHSDILLAGVSGYGGGSATVMGSTGFADAYTRREADFRLSVSSSRDDFVKDDLLFPEPIDYSLVDGWSDFNFSLRLRERIGDTDEFAVKDLYAHNAIVTSLKARPAESVPEPTTLALFGLGLVGLVVSRRRNLAAA